METNRIKYHRHIYQVNKKNNSTCFSEYTRVKNSIHQAILPASIRIEVNRGFNNGKNFNEWLAVYNVTNWPYGNRVTGLRALKKLPNVYFGDLIDPEVKEPTPGSLIFFEFSANREILVIDVFKNFYPDSFTFRFMVASHKFLLRKKARQ